MALIHCNFFSEVLGISTSMCVILPQETKNQIGMKGAVKREKYPTLYLLHGYSDDHTIWQRRTAIERYVSSLGIAVVMPNAGKSYYTDMKKGDKYFTFISEEVPKLARSFFHLSESREDNFIAGLSMGGYGAFKVALTYPERFCAAASLSGSLDIVSTIQSLSSSEDIDTFANVFGEVKSVQNSENDLFHLVKNLIISDKPKPKLYQCCGTEDFLFEQNNEFRDFICKTSLDYVYEYNTGSHEWGYWDKQIQRVLEWLPRKDVLL